MIDSQKLAQGIELSQHPEVQKAAHQFMSDNGYKYTEAGRLVAESAAAEWCDNRDDVGIDFKAAICAAILTVPEPVL